MNNVFRGGHVLSLCQYQRSDLEMLFARADELAAMDRLCLNSRLTGRIMVTAFYQRSTRTRLAHESAIARLGGQTIGFVDPEITRAADFARESLDDVARMLVGYGDVLVLRHGERGVPARVAAWSAIPVINAGDGAGEHPTQAMVDLYTMRLRFGRLDGLRVLLMGDMRMRTANSLLLGLSLFDCQVSFVAPPEMQPHPDVLAYLAGVGVTPVRAPRTRDVLSEVDVLYVQPVVQPDTVTTPQAPPPTPPDYLVDLRLLRTYGHDRLLVLHPLPRHDELCQDVDDTEHNGYWTAATNGVLVRMALLDLMLGD
nr:aspartate carbamoyltransferase [Kibdelosporangium sp. MJ126-NF4]